MVVRLPLRSGLLARFARCEAGSFGLWAGVAFPALALIAFASVELADVTHEKTRLQDVADAAAVMAAKEMAMSLSSGIEDRAEGFALQQLADVSATSTVTAEAEIVDRQVSVTLVSNRIGFFANLLPPGGFWIRTKATAEVEGSQPLCVLTLGSDKKIEVKDTSELLAGGCQVASNHEIEVDNHSVQGIRAGFVQSVGKAVGPISPRPYVNAGFVADPFAGREFPAATCRPPEGVEPPMAPVIENQEIDAGVHCDGLDVAENTTLTLRPGIHYFPRGDLEMRRNSYLVGTNVVLVFGKDAKVKFNEDSRADLTGRESGPYAGMVFVATPQNNENFEIRSVNVDRLEGVVYLPNATLEVSGLGRIGENSDWTVTVTRKLKVEQGAKLTIATNYAQSTVPVPSGVGNRTDAGKVRLIR